MNKLAYLLNLFFLLLLSPTAIFSAPLNLSNVPLYLGGNVNPNIMFILDDSGSMQFETMPDALTNMFSQSCCTNYQMWVYPRVNGLHGSDDYAATRVPSFTQSSIMNRAFRSSYVNTLYYNPAITYLPWVNANGTSMPNASPSAAPNRPLFPGFGTRNLTADNTQTVPWMDNRTNSSTNASRTFYPAVYWTYTGPAIADLNAAILDANSALWVAANYTRTEIRSSTSTYSGHGRENRTECSGGVCTYEQEIQNFANWYSYHRNRIFASRAGIGRAFATQSETMRVGYGAINKSASSVDSVSTNTIINGVRPFTGSSRTDFYTQLYQRDIPALGTPLRRALGAAGEYFSRADERGPWSTTPGQAGGEDLICRQSYTILMSDGAASGTTTNAAAGNASQNNDGTTDNSTENSNPDGTDYSYSPINPFQDNISGTLADAAMYYWKRDLRTDLENKVPTTLINPAYWQHMVTFTVGLGVSGSIDPDDAFAAIATSASINWGNPDYSNANCTGATCTARQDDFLHAALNSRGGFFSAADPDTFATELAGILSNIADRTSSASSVALNSGSISTDSKVFQARFNSGDWTGQLLAFPIINDSGNENFGNLSSPAAWDARNLIPAANDRRILTFDGTEGRPFRWSSISTEQQALLISEANLNYLRGNKSNEQSNGGNLRNRNYLLGDIINSAPAFVAAPFQRYPDNWGSGAAENASPYSSFKATNSNRQPLIYVGANDGMLHAFNADTGAEWFAYVPGVVYNNLLDLTNPNYGHKYYVDGSPTVVDAFINNQWRSILVSGLGGGGQGVFALDVTNPSDFLNEGTAASRVLWEFTDEYYVSEEKNGRDLGFTYGDPSIVRLQNGEWAAIFSGGYNNTIDNNGDGNTADSSTGNAVLFIVRLSDGELIETIDTEVGTAQDPTGQSRPNGLASPAAVDVDGDFIVDYVYAGDLFGNMWKFDLTSSTPSDWRVAYESGGNPQPLFNACFGNTCDSGNIQPITTRPQVVRHPTSNGFLVLFGTGKYLEVGDNSAINQTTQTFYAIWDKRQDELTPFNRLKLLEQKVTQEVTVDGTSYRVTSDKSINWTNDLGWYIDLLSPNTTDNLGERQVSNSIIRNGRVIFTTLLPSTDPCLPGGSGWLMELNYATGARLSYSPFDITGDGIFNEEDFICIANCELDADGNPDPNRVLVPASGKKSDVGIIPTPSIASEAGGQREFKYTSGSSGNIEVTVENPGPGFEGRQSWRQLDFQFR
jgi:type IV pilus assembly protein PilY1